MDTSFSFRTGLFQIEEIRIDTVGLDGGIVHDDSTGLEFYFPKNLMPDGTLIVISRVSNPAEMPDSLRGFGPLLHLWPEGCALDSTVLLKIPYNSSDLDQAGISDPMEFIIRHYSVVTGEWTKLPLTASDDHTITLALNAFCYIQRGKGNATSDMTDESDISKPSDFCLSQNYPNPFNPFTQIQYAIPRTGKVQLIIYNTLGQSVGCPVHEIQETGAYTVGLSGDDYANGIYVYGLWFDGICIQSRKFMVMK
jgi:hypothetical protein